MKNLLLKCLLFAMFTLGASNSQGLSSASIQADGGAIADIIGKMQTTSFAIPDSYINDGSLSTPLYLVIQDNNKEKIYSLATYDLTIMLPDLPTLKSGYDITIKIGKYSYTQTVH